MNGPRNGTLLREDPPAGLRPKASGPVGAPSADAPNPFASLHHTLSKAASSGKITTTQANDLLIAGFCELMKQEKAL